MSDIEISVAGTPPKGTYTSNSQAVSSDGDIEITPGTTSIRFDRGRGETWVFEDPWITFEPRGPFTTIATERTSIEISDDDSGGETESYEYTLHTSQGTFDPKIINKGSGG